MCLVMIDYSDGNESVINSPRIANKKSYTTNNKFSPCALHFLDPPFYSNAAPSPSIHPTLCIAYAEKPKKIVTIHLVVHHYHPSSIIIENIYHAKKEVEDEKMMRKMSCANRRPKSRNRKQKKNTEATLCENGRPFS